MKHYFRSMILGLSIALLGGCHYYPGQGFFGPRYSDESVTASVHRALEQNPMTAAARIHVETHQGNVTLSGRVRTIRQNDVANDVTYKVPGVRSVQNNLIVRR
ncbi:MAG: BON domain-containing protein [Legionella sp.]|nr:BON domain-containing protein [Legionella sp.]